MPPSRWAPIEEAIHEFQGHLAPHVPQFKIEKGVNCAESYPTRKTACPPLQKYGVYLIFDDSESQVYIGMALDRRLINRCLDHLTVKPFTRFIPRWVDVIPLDWKWAFFAPSLERYLIEKVSLMEGYTIVNRRGRIIDPDRL